MVSRILLDAGIDGEFSSLYRLLPHIRPNSLHLWIVLGLCFKQSLFL
jgi:hypothetical protein